MEKLTFFLISIVTFLTIVSGLFAQPTYEQLCPPCSGATCSVVSPSEEYVYVDANGWGHEAGTYYENGIACYYDVVFKIRECICPGGAIERDIYIRNIIFSPGCSGLNYEGIMRSAMKMLLRYAPAYFGIEQWPARFDVSILINSCWTFVSTPGQADKLEPCSTSACCKTKYGVINAGSYLIEKERQLIPPPNCSGIVGQTCDYYCDVNDLPIGSLLDANSTTCDNDPCPEVPLNDTFHDSNCMCNDLFNPGGSNCCPPPVNGCSYEDCGFDRSFVGKTHVRIDPFVCGLPDAAYGYISYKTCPSTGNRLVRLDKILLSSGLNGYNISEIIICVLRYVHYNTTMLFEDCNYDNPKLYYIYLPGCWKQINQTQYGGGPAWLVPCDPQECCWYIIRLGNQFAQGQHPGCSLPSGIRIASSGGLDDSGDLVESCSTYSNCDPRPICVYVIDDPRIYSPGQLPRRSDFSEDISSKANPPVKRKLETVVAGSELSIWYYPASDEYVKVKIIDILGEKVYEVEGQSNKQPMKWTINLKEWTSGTYFVVASEGDTITDYRKFIYSR